MRRHGRDRRWSDLPRAGRFPCAAICAAAALALAVAAALAGCGGGDPPAGPTPSPSGPATSLAADAPADASGAAASPGPVVYLLGGSSARECIESNTAWAAAIRAAGGPDVLAVDLGATNQSFSGDRRLTKGMPRGSLVLIGISLGRYTSPPPRALGDKPLDDEARAALAGGVEVKHHYSVNRVHTDERKGQILGQWLAERYELYRRNYDANLEELELLLRACRKRGLRVALLELPLNLEFVGAALDAPREMYREDCRRLAAKSGAPFLSFVEEVDLTNDEFYDLAHLVEPGRAKWQARLAAEVVALLDDLR